MGEPEKTQQKTRSEQKTDLKALKMKKPHANIVEDAKHLWELVRKKKQTKDERNETIEKLMAITSGNALNIIFKHDASRIVQCLLKYGSVKQRNSIAQELTGNYIKLATSQYGKFIILRVLQYCNAQQRSTVVTEFFGNVRKLCRHNEASLVLDQAYAQYATAAQRLSLMQEFYGPEYALFKDVHFFKIRIQSLCRNYSNSTLSRNPPS